MNQEELKEFENKRIRLLLNGHKYCMSGKLLKVYENSIEIIDLHESRTKIAMNHIIAISEVI